MTTLRSDMARLRRIDAFTLVEVLVSIVITALIVVLAGQLTKSATTVATSAGKHIDTDVQARAVLDRMAVDFAKMLKRTDVDYYIKAPIGYKNPNGHNNTKHLKTGQPGNDQIAFFSQVPGYNSTTSTLVSPLSLVAYRINAGSTTSQTYLQLERMGKALLWNGVKNANNDPYPIVFLPGQIPGAVGAWGINANNGGWAAAINNDNGANSVDLESYAQIGPQVFRLEYYYLLKDGSIKDVPALSWDFSQTVSANLNAFADVEAIVIAIAVIDPASRLLLYNSSNPGDPYLRLFNMLSDMADFKNANGNGVGAQKVGDVENQWNAAIQHAATTGTTYDGSPFPAAAASAIRVYNRYFDLKTPAGF
jgi:Prokaryotic N-terminal methylation motif